MQTIAQKDIILKFRDMVSKRYAYDDLVERFDLPEEISPEVIAEIEHYFLNSIYPEPDRRAALEDAFEGLALYIQHPKKLWGIMGNMTKAIFRFGRQFPVALKSGFDALQAYFGTLKFEEKMVSTANEMQMQAPLSDDEFEQIIAALPHEEVVSFIKHVNVLFKSMCNTSLLEKTVEILETVAATMRSKPDVYPQKDIDGILLGQGILKDGFALFSKHDERTKQLMVEYIYKNEMWFLDDVHEKWEVV